MMLFKLKINLKKLIKPFHIQKIAKEELHFKFSTTIKFNNYIKDTKSYE